MTKTVSVIIPVFNDPINLKKCLAAIFETDHRDFEVIVVDDGSDQQLEPIVKQFPCMYLRIPSNMGQAYCRNFGVKHCQGEVLLFTDSDCVVMNNWVKEFLRVLEEAHQKAQEIVAVCGRHVGPKGFMAMTHVHTGYAYVLSGLRRELEYLNTSCVAVYKDAFLKVGGFSENMRNGEDPDLALKLIGNGQRVIFDPAIWIFHNHGINSFTGMVRKHKLWGHTIGLTLMEKHPERFQPLLSYLKQPVIHFFLIVPLAVATTIKLIKHNFENDKKIIMYSPFILINKIFFRWGVFVRSLSP